MPDKPRLMRLGGSTTGVTGLTLPSIAYQSPYHSQFPRTILPSRELKVEDLRPQYIGIDLLYKYLTQVQYLIATGALSPCVLLRFPVEFDDFSTFWSSRELKHFSTPSYKL